MTIGPHYLSELAAGAMALPFILAACNVNQGPGSSTGAAATDVYFQPNYLAEIKLTESQGAVVRKVAARFSKPSEVQRRKSIPGYKEGDFVVGQTRYAWQGKLLYRNEKPGRELLVVEDERLTPFSDAFLKALGDPPYRRLTTNDWGKILQALNSDEKDDIAR